MSKIFKPRRGKASTMAGTKSSTVLAAGEMFIELPDTGVGTGVCKMKMGDGVTSYASLPYAMGGDIATTEITGGIVEDGSSSATAALANVTTGKTLGQIIGSLRKACQLNASAIATLNDEAARNLNSGYWFFNIVSFAGYITGSGNYVGFLIPINININKTYALSYTDLSVIGQNHSYNETAGAINQIRKYKIGIFVEITLVSPLTYSTAVTVNVSELKISVTAS